ncbi:hypothetical protein N7499_009995 [Penicillium canescens]|nr:hypothetical protein N7499_009995 [Penicillium canescens]KAJ6170659.1 hypothetical protein N7485_008005 [Penicillium canescens]
MLRRRPTIILLEDLDSLQLFPLTTDFQKLTLDEQEQSYDDLLGDLSSCASEATTSIDLTAPSHGKPSCERDTSSPSPGIFASPSTAPPSAPASTKSCLKSHLPIRESLQNTSPGVKPRRASQSTDPPRPKVTFALSPQEQELHSGRANRSPEEQEDDRIENWPRPDTTTALSLDSPALTPQLSFLSCGVSSSPATASVPLRDLVLASTQSYEAVLAEKTVSPELGDCIGKGRGIV